MVGEASLTAVLRGGRRPRGSEKEGYESTTPRQNYIGPARIYTFRIQKHREALQWEKKYDITKFSKN